MKRLILEIVICLVAAVLLMVLHELFKAVIFVLLRVKENNKQSIKRRGIWKLWRYIDPVGLVLAVTCYVPVSKPFMFRIRDKKTNLIIGISGLVFLAVIFFGSVQMLHIIYGTNANAAAALNSSGNRRAGILFWQYMQMLSFDYFIVNLFPVSTFDMGHIIAGKSARIYLGIIKADTQIKLLLILTLFLNLINAGYMGFIKFSLFIAVLSLKSKTVYSIKRRYEKMSSISVKLEVFDGPLDLLLHLIEKNKIDIFDIPIAEITRQYMEILSASETDDMDVMSDFLVMAATLLKIKSKMLLPVQVDEDGEEIDPRAELVERLLEYKTFKYASYELKDKQMDAEKILYKKSTIPKGIADYKETVDVSELLGDVTLARLRSIFNDVMKKQIDKIDPIRSKFGQIKKETVSLQDRMLYIEEYAMRHKSFSFRTMLEKNPGKTMVIVTFLGILELMKVGKLLIVQERIFDDIKITYNSLAPDVEYIPSSAG